VGTEFGPLLLFGGADRWDVRQTKTYSTPIPHKRYRSTVARTHRVSTIMFREKNQRNTNAVKTPKKHETPSTKRETVEDDKHKQHISKKEEGNPQMLDELQPQQQQPEEESHHGPPPDGLECLATMEDITLEDQNYGM